MDDTFIAELASRYPELAAMPHSLTDNADPSPHSSLTPTERLLATFTASVRSGSAGHAHATELELLANDCPPWLIDAIRKAAGSWTVSDDDRIDVIVDYTATRTRQPNFNTTRDRQRLHAVGLNDYDIIELDHIIAASIGSVPPAHDASTEGHGLGGRSRNHGH